MLRASACALFPLLLAPPSADEVRLADGRRLVGEVTEQGDSLEVETRHGVVTVRRDQVVSIRSEKELRKEFLALARKSPKSAFGHLQLARTALDFGLERDLWKQLDRCLEALGEERAEGADRAALDERLRDFLSTLEPEVLGVGFQGDTEGRVKTLVRTARLGAAPSLRRAVIELLVRTPEADEALRFQARRALRPEQRTAAVEALLRRPAKGNDSFAWRTAILDDDADVREQTARLTARLGDPEAAIRYLAPGFLHDAPVVRMRTANAFADMEHRSAVPLLVWAGPLAGVPMKKALQGGNVGHRAHMSALEQRSYIRDFDVEIAQAAAVANPIVDTIQSGVVLDAHVAAVVSQQIEIAISYRRALRNLVGADPGPDPKEWRGWVADHDPAAAEVLAEWEARRYGR